MVTKRVKELKKYTDYRERMIEWKTTCLLIPISYYPGLNSRRLGNAVG